MKDNNLSLNKQINDVMFNECNVLAAIVISNKNASMG